MKIKAKNIPKKKKYYHNSFTSHDKEDKIQQPKEYSGHCTLKNISYH